MNNYIIVFLLLVCFKIPSHAQQSFRVQYDSIILAPGNSYGLSKFKVVRCADNGYGIFEQTTFPGALCWIIKTDSNGVIEWNREFPLFNPESSGPAEIIATPDTGFYLTSYEENTMFGAYPKTFFYKVNKLGEITKNNVTGWGNSTSSYSFEFLNVELPGNHLYAKFFQYDYNGTNGPCCYNNGVVIFDSAFAIQKSIEFINNNVTVERIMKMDVVKFNNIPSGYIFMSLSGSSANHHLTLTDSSGAVLWSKIISIDIRDSYKIFQHDSSFYISGIHWPGASQKKSFLYKINYSGNIDFFKTFDTPDKFTIHDINLYDSTSLALAGIFNNSLGYPHGTMLISDLDGNITQAVVSTDSLYTNAFFDPITKAFLFTRSYSSVNKTGFQFEKVFINNPSCNFIPFTLNTKDTVFTDSTGSVTMQPFPVPMNGAIKTRTVPILTTSFISSSVGINEMITNDNPEFIFFPNPTTSVINLKINSIQTECRVNIFDNLGQTIYSKFHDTESIEIPVSAWKKGIYYISVVINHTVLSEKFIVQ